jgi:histidyl-tRNA synthetase
MIETIRGVYERYGFEPVETPVHRIHRRAREIPAGPGPAERGRFLVQDDDEQWLSLRYDLTAPLARLCRREL